MKVLVTGGAGFIGSHVADALLAQGHEVVVFDDLSTGRRENVPAGATFVEGDLRSEADVDRVFAEHRPDWVSHQGAQTSVSKSTREPLLDAAINVMGTLHVLRASVRHEIQRLVFASTGGAIYGEVPEGERATTAWMPQPISPYACSKLAGEAYLGAFSSEFGLPTQILRYANVYGPRQDPHGEAGVVAIFSQRIHGGEALRINARKEAGDDGCVRDYVYVGDVVAANLRGLRGELDAPVVNVGTGVEATTKQIALGLARALGKEPEITFGDRREGDLERSLLEPGTGPDLVPLDEGLAQTAAWFAERSGR
ncbi:MAG: UDP-glucose 4-epimerase [Sandaracinus sp.]|nr:UDP-glucose 4-epimerase [Sandaracinus sp.]